VTGRGQTTRRRTNADGAWKRVLADLLPDCLAFTVPELYTAVDWSVPPLSLDKEFQAVVRQAAIGPRVADHLVQLRLRSGEITWLVLHVEVQGQPQEDFAARMFTYYALLHLRLWRRRQGAGHDGVPLILGLALLTDGRASWRPGPYQAREFGQGVRYDYWAIKLLDWQDRTDALTSSDNPFALVVYAWLGALAAQGRADSLLGVARAVLRQLRRSGYSDDRMTAILAFLEQVVTPQELLEELVEELVAEEATMAQVTSYIEREGMRKGRREGRQEGRREALLETALLLLGHKLGPVDEATTAQVGALSDSQLVALHTAALDFTESADLERWLQAASTPQ
jgi:predicted transposase YdaD